MSVTKNNIYNNKKKLFIIVICSSMQSCMCPFFIEVQGIKVMNKCMAIII